MLMGCAVILLMGFLFGVRLQCGFYFWLAVVLNGFAFSALAVALAMLVKSHADQGLLNNFIITPMAFLGGTFFPMEKLPGWAQDILFFLPLTHASQAIRAAAFGLPPNPQSFLVLAVAGGVFFLFAFHTVGKAKD